MKNIFKVPQTLVLSRKFFDSSATVIDKNRGFLEIIFLIFCSLGLVYLLAQKAYAAFGAVLLLIFGLVLLINPMAINYLLLIMVPFPWLFMFGSRIRAVLLLTVIAFAYTILKKLFQREYQRFEPITNLFFVLLFLFALSTFNSFDIIHSFLMMKTWIASLLFYYTIVSNIKTFQHAKTFINILLVLGFISGVLGLLQTLVSPVFFPEVTLGAFSAEDVDIAEGYKVIDTYRASGTFENGPRYAHFLLLPLGIAFTSLVQKKAMNKIWAIFLLVVISLGIVVSFTRAAIIFALFYGVIYTVIENKWSAFFKLSAIAVIIALILLPLLFFILPTKVVDTVSVRFKEQEPENEFEEEAPPSWIWRVAMNYVAFRTFLSHPFLGIGVATFGIRFWEMAQLYPIPWQKYREVSNMISTYDFMDSHNAYATILAETGMFSFLAYIIIFMITFRYLFFALRKSENLQIKAWALGTIICFLILIIYWAIHEYLIAEAYTSMLPIIIAVILKNLVKEEQTEKTGQEIKDLDIILKRI